MRLSWGGVHSIVVCFNQLRFTAPFLFPLPADRVTFAQKKIPTQSFQTERKNNLPHKIPRAFSGPHFPL